MTAPPQPSPIPPDTASIDTIFSFDMRRDYTRVEPQTPEDYRHSETLLETELDRVQPKRKRPKPSHTKLNLDDGIETEID